MMVRIHRKKNKNNWQEQTLRIQTHKHMYRHIDTLSLSLSSTHTGIISKLLNWFCAVSTRKYDLNLVKKQQQEQPKKKVQLTKYQAVMMIIWIG